MTREELVRLYGEMDRKLVAITASKAHDYANADVLSNFKKVSMAAKELGIDPRNPTGYALFMVILKIARLGNLLEEDKEPNNESLEDTFYDGINYFKLAYCCYKEAENNKIHLRND